LIALPHIKTLEWRGGGDRREVARLTTTTQNSRDIYYGKTVLFYKGSDWKGPKNFAHITYRNDLLENKKKVARFTTTTQNSSDIYYGKTVLFYNGSDWKGPKFFAHITYRNDLLENRLFTKQKCFAMLRCSY
jgi:hypothetical protein